MYSPNFTGDIFTCDVPLAEPLVVGDGVAVATLRTVSEAGSFLMQPLKGAG
jgi:hypothetical protein